MNEKAKAKVITGVSAGAWTWAAEVNQAGEPTGRQLRFQAARDIEAGDAVELYEGSAGWIQAEHPKTLLAVPPDSFFVD